MTAGTEKRGGPGGIPWRMIGWGSLAAILLLPFVTNAPWTPSDYVLMGLMLGSAGLVVELAARASGDFFYRAGAGIAVAAVFMLIWVNLAVGFFGDEDNAANLMFLGVVGVAALGSLFAGPKPAGMAGAMLAAAGAQVLVGIVGYHGGHASPGASGIYEAAMGTTLFTGLWLLSAALFRKSAARQGVRQAAR
jgi:hypothetical protein